MLNMLRGNQATIDAIPIIDGQLLFNTTTKTILMDEGSTRIPFGGVVADSSISTTSTNPIQNQAVGNAIIDNLDTIKTTTENLKIAGALALKTAYNEINQSLNNGNLQFLVNESGKLQYRYEV